MKHEAIPAEVDAIAHKIVGAALEVHRALGPGLLESVYEECLAHEIRKHGLSVGRQLQVPIVYDGIRFDAGFKVDLLVDKKVIVELKGVEKVLPVHKAQVLTYLKLANCRLGLLINFNVPLIKDGISRIVL